MNLRSPTTITLSVAFAVLIITGVLLYATPFNYMISSLHIWGAILFLLCIVWHIKHNAKVYKNHLQKRAGKWSLGTALFGLIPISLGLVFALPPIASVIDFGYNLKQAGTPAHGEYTLIDLSADPLAPSMNVFIKAGPEYESAPQPLFLTLTYSSVPQIAIWMETLDGKYIDTLYITGKGSDSSYRSKDPAIDVVRRPEALPYWNHKRGIQASDGLFAPVPQQGDLDAIASATPRADYQVKVSAPRMGRYRLMLEVNRSYDFNEFYHATRFPDDPIYSGSGSSGQPSLIYAAEIDSQTSGQYLLSVIGRGHHSGADGNLYTELHNISSAKHILEFVVATLE